VEPTPSASKEPDSSNNQHDTTEEEEEEEEEEDVPPQSLDISTSTPLPPSRSPSSTSTYSPSMLRNLIAQSCQSGDLPRLKFLFAQHPDSDELFTLSNAINPTTGFAPLHHAAKKGHLEVVKWLIEDCGALSGLEDSDGETALHKAALSGRIEVAEYLVGIEGIEIDGQDNDGWTVSTLLDLATGASLTLRLSFVCPQPLHNAASTGSLPLMSLLLANGSSLSPLSSHGYTPLMNAASKGHLPSVHLLLKRGADPLIRNRWGETAYDLAAGVFEVRCCEVLGSYERFAWSARQNKAEREGKGQIVEDYSLLSLHSTIPVVLYENQRLVTPSLAKFPALSNLVSGQQRWTSKALSRNDRRSAFTLPRQVLEGMATNGGIEEEGEGEERACFRSEVGLPLVGKENSLVIPEKREIRSGGRVRSSISTDGAPSQTLKKKRKQPSLASNSFNTILASTSTSPPLDPPSTSTSSHGTPAWVWLSSWTIDLSSPLSSPIDGWSYSQSFDTPSDEWQPEFPLEGAGSAKKWVRRRRWVRVMRRRVDLKSWGYLDEPVRDDGDYRTKARFMLSQHQSREHEQGQEEENDPETSPSASPRQGNLRRQCVTLERAAEELRNGIEVDEDEERKREAQTDLEKILEKIALVRVSSATSCLEDEVVDSDEEFVYSGQDAGEDDGDDTRSIWTTTRPSSLLTPSISHGREASSSDYVSKGPTTTQHPDLTPQLAQNPEFRVPTDEHASFYPTTSRSSSGQFSQHHRTPWEPDEAASECRRCGTGFSFFKRKHHCRRWALSPFRIPCHASRELTLRLSMTRCGRVVCASCSSHKDPIDPYLVVREPGIPPTLEDLQPWVHSTPLLYRTCDSCHAALALPQGISSNHPSSILSPQTFFPPSPSVGSATPSETNVSEASELSECPCCGASLGGFGSRENQEAHVRKCLEEGEGSISSGRYLGLLTSLSSVGRITN